MSDLVYPNMGNTTNAQACAFFSALPRAVGDLRAAGILKPRDVDVLRELLDHKNRRTTTVDPKQATLAARFNCSLDTVQRSLARLAAAGLIVKIRLRDRLGRLGRCVYDLAGTLALMPSQAAKLRSGAYGRQTPPSPPSADGNRVPASHSTMPQKSGLSEVDEGCYVEADTQPQPQTDATRATVVLLQAQAVQEHAAKRLADRHTEARCREVVQASARIKHFRHSRAAWIIGALDGGWTVSTEAETRPRSQWPYRPPQADTAPARAAVAPPQDPLETLDAPTYAALETEARASLWTETKPAWRNKLLNRPNAPLIRTRMRALLTQANGGQPCSTAACA